MISMHITYCPLSAPPICPTGVHHQLVLLQTFLEKTNGTISFSYKNYLLGMMFIFEKNIQNIDFWLVIFPLVVGST